VDDRVQLVFSWDPRARVWLKERGPDNAAKPPASPLDDGAVQTYFLDPQTGRWVGTILGARARTIGNELGTYYRSPGAVGLAVEEEEEPKSGLYVEGTERRKPVMPVAVIGGVILAIVIGAGAVASKTLFAAGEADARAAIASAAAASAAAASAASGGPQASTAPSAATSEAPAATPEPTTPGQTARPRTPAPTALPRTPAPTAPPIQPGTITLTALTADGTRLTYTGANIVSAGFVVNITVTAVLGDGTASRSQIAMRIGPSGGWSPATRDSQGRYTAPVPVNTNKGAQPLYVLFGSGQNAAAYSLGNLFVN